jgi:hypothetical protein
MKRTCWIVTGVATMALAGCGGGGSSSSAWTPAEIREAESKFASNSSVPAGTRRCLTEGVVAKFSPSVLEQQSEPTDAQKAVLSTIAASCMQQYTQSHASEGRAATPTTATGSSGTEHCEGLEPEECKRVTKLEQETREKGSPSAQGIREAAGEKPGETPYEAGARKVKEGEEQREREQAAG